MPTQNSLHDSKSSAGEAAGGRGATWKIMPLRRAIYPVQDPNVHAEQDTTLRTKFSLAILPAISDTTTVTVVLGMYLSGAIQVIIEPSSEISPSSHDHS